MVQTPDAALETASDVLAYWRSRGRVYEEEHARRGLRDRARFGYQELRLRRVLRSLDASTLLDVGCGYGRLLVLSARASPRTALAGCDTSPAQIANARRLLGSRADLRTGSLPSLPYGDGAFDAVLCSEVLMHQPPEAAAPATFELARIARRAVVTVDWWDPKAPSQAGGYCWQHDTAARLRAEGFEVETISLEPVVAQRIVVARRP